MLVAQMALIIGCAVNPHFGRSAVPLPRSEGCSDDVSRRSRSTAAKGVEIGIASYYGAERAGMTTASGQRFDPSALTAAHRSLPFGTRVRVTNLDNGLTVTVIINDRGPYVRGRIVDLSFAAARRIGMIAAGTARVKIEVVR